MYSSLLHLLSRKTVAIKSYFSCVTGYLFIFNMLEVKNDVALYGPVQLFTVHIKNTFIYKQLLIA